MNKIITIISPCYNERDNIKIFYNKIQEIFNTRLKNYNYELIIVDDNSKDGSDKILKDLAASDPQLKIIINNRNYGVHKSTFNAIKYSNGDALIPMLPVDMQDTPELIIDFIKKWEDGYDIVYGIKKKRNESFILRNFRNLYYLIVNKISNIEIPPYVGEFQLIEKKLYKELLSYDDYYPYTRGIIANLSSNSIGVEYTWQKRIHGKSKMDLFKLFDLGINGLISFSNFPIRIFTIFGILIASASVMFIIFQLFTHFFIDGRMNTPGISTLIVALFFFSGIQLLFLGIVGEYISAIHSQVRKPKNNVIIKEKINIE
ncbi:glycosyltransferase family 2 protein [Candidatus Pelagibacter sp. HIMB1521]|uniref:glycosyltransferase family 2 protein n=1 Tax=Candidatus Pelagibacter sp. HIMB1521 TaxID=3413344 RepID=UPI003F82FEE9